MRPSSLEVVLLDEEQDKRKTNARQNSGKDFLIICEDKGLRVQLNNGQHGCDWINRGRRNEKFYWNGHHILKISILFSCLRVLKINRMQPLL
jgi:hypothetical protein